MVGAVFMTTRHLFIRKFKGTYAPFSIGLDTAILHNITLMISSVILTTTDHQKDFSWTLRTFLLGAISGTLMDAGVILVGIASCLGIAAAAQALMSTHAIHQTFWSAMVDKQAVNLLETFGLALGVVGVVVISLAVYIERFVRGIVIYVTGNVQITPVTDVPSDGATDVEEI
jgi:hypothetical protein